MIGPRSGPMPRQAVSAITPPSGVHVWLAAGVTDMRRGMNGLALQVQQGFRRDPHTGDLYVFHGKRGDLLKILWHDGLGMSLYAKRLERGRFIWPTPSDGMVAITTAQLGYMLEGIDWRNPLRTWRPEAAG
jgi:transposase